MSRSFGSYSTFIFDLDGCVYFENSLAEGAAALISMLQQIGKNVRFLSNNSTHSPIDVRSKLRSMGVDTETDCIHLASTLAAQFLHEQYGSIRVCVAGTESLCAEVARYGHTVIDLESDQGGDVLLMGRDIGFTYRRFELCVEQILAGAKLVAANADRFHPTMTGGRRPETGALAGAVAEVTGVRPIFVGKPEPYAYQAAMDTGGQTPDECLMIGDNFETDIMGACRVGMDGCWIDLQKRGTIQGYPTVRRYSSMKALSQSIRAELMPAQHEAVPYTV